MKRLTAIAATACAAALLALTVAAGAQAHENPTDPTHKHGLQIRSGWCIGGSVTLEWEESARRCDGDVCAYTCLYQVWSDWQAADGYRGRDTEPSGGGYYRCDIARSWNPNLARTAFEVTQPSWGTGNWGLYVRDGWDRTTVRCR